MGIVHWSANLSQMKALWALNLPTVCQVRQTVKIVLIWLKFSLSVHRNTMLALSCLILVWPMKEKSVLQNNVNYPSEGKILLKTQTAGINGIGPGQRQSLSSKAALEKCNWYGEWLQKVLVLVIAYRTGKRLFTRAVGSTLSFVMQTWNFTAWSTEFCLYWCVCSCETPAEKAYTWWQQSQKCSPCVNSFFSVQDHRKNSCCFKCLIISFPTAC